MAKTAKQKSSKVVSSAKEVWPVKCRNWLRDLVASVTGQRENSYKFVALIMLGKFGSLKDGELVQLGTGEQKGKHIGWYGKSANSISETTKKKIHKFLEDGQFKNFDRSYYGSIWSDIYAQAKLPRFGFATAPVNGSIHWTLDAQKTIDAIEKGDIVIAIKNTKTEKVKGDGNDGRSNKKWYKQRPDGTYVKENGLPVETTAPATSKPTDPAKCRGKAQVEHAMAYWKKVRTNATAKIRALEAKQ